MCKVLKNFILNRKKYKKKNKKTVYLKQKIARKISKTKNSKKIKNQFTKK